MKFFEVFKAGTYPQGRFSKSQIEELAKNYDPKFCEAPITLDHEQKGPAYGWVSGLKAENGKLKASFKNLSPELKEFVQSGKYKKISVEIYRELDGKKPYLKAVSFLGASIPQVKGMAAVEFKEGKSDVFSFSFEDEGGADTETIEKCKEKICELEEEVTELEAEVEALEKETDELEEKIDALEKETDELEEKIETLEKENKELEEEIEKLREDTQIQEVESFISKQIEGGKLTPANKALVTDVLKELENVKKFGADKNVVKNFKAFIETLPKQVEFSEVATKGKTSTKTKDVEKFANANEESVEIFNAAKALAEKDGISFKEALLKLEI